MGCISLLGGAHFAFPGVQMGCIPETGWGANYYPGVQTGCIPCKWDASSFILDFCVFLLRIADNQYPCSYDQLLLAIRVHWNISTILFFRY